MLAQRWQAQVLGLSQGTAAHVLDGHKHTVLAAGQFVWHLLVNVHSLRLTPPCVRLAACLGAPAPLLPLRPSSALHMRRLQDQGAASSAPHSPQCLVQIAAVHLLCSRGWKPHLGLRRVRSSQPGIWLAAACLPAFASWLKPEVALAKHKCSL